MPEAVWAVVVARVGHGAKSRLAPALDPQQRRDLALAMLADVLEICCTTGLDGVVAVVDDAVAAATARSCGALVVLDDLANDMNAAARSGLRCAARQGASTAIVLPGDVPLISGMDLQALRHAAGDAERAVVVGASRDGRGTNALLLRPPTVIQPAFGPPSVERHLRLGVAAGAETRTLRDLNLALDVDTPADLERVFDLAAPEHTSGVLASLRRASLSSI